MFNFEKDLRFYEVKFEYPNFFKSNFTFEFYVPANSETNLIEAETRFNEQAYDSLLKTFIFNIDCIHILKNRISIFFDDETEDIIPITEEQRIDINNLAISEGDYDILMHTEDCDDYHTYYSIEYVDINLFKKILRILETK